MGFNSAFKGLIWLYGSQSAVEPSSKQVRITVFLGLSLRGWAKYRIRVTPNNEIF